MINGKPFTVAKSKGSGLDKFDVAVFSASCDTAETNKKYAAELKLDYPILSDPTKSTAEAYGVVHGNRRVPERWTYIIGIDGKILHIDKGVKTRSHGADLSAKLGELGVAKK